MNFLTVPRIAALAALALLVSFADCEAARWTPTQLPNLALWLDGSDTNTLFLDTGGTQAITNSGAVARWKDKSPTVSCRKVSAEPGL